MCSRLIAAALGISLLVSACGGTTSAGPSGSAATKPDVKVGLAISLTGAASSYGPAQQNGAKLAMEQINAAGGINGAKLTLVVEDDASARDQGIAVFRKFINESKVAAILGPTLSGVAVGAHPVAQQAGVPVIAISNTGIGIVGRCDYGPCDWIFRVSLGEETTLPAALKAAKDKLNLKKVVLMFETDPKFAADGVDIFKKAAADNGITISRTIPYTTADVDFAAFVTQAKDENPDAILCSGLAANGGRIMLELAKQFSGGGVRVVGSNGFNSRTIFQRAGRSASELMIVGSAWNGASTEKPNADFVKAFKDAYVSDPDQFAAQSYTAMLVLAEAMRKTSDPNDKAALKKALEGTSLNTPLGPFSFTQQHDVKQPVFVMTAKDGQFVPFN